MTVAILSSRERRERYRFLSDPLINAGYDVKVVFTSPFFKLLWALWRQAGGWDVAILFGTYPKSLFVYGWLRVIGVTVIFRLGGDPVRDSAAVAFEYKKNRKYIKWLRAIVNSKSSEFVLGRAKNLFVVNEKLLDRLLGRLKGHARLFVIPQFCEGSAVPKMYAIGSVVNVLTVTNFRYMEKAKGVIWLIQQLVRFVQQENQRVNLKILGDGEHRKDILNYMSEVGLPDILDIQAPGFVEDTSPYYKGADIFIYRSFHDGTPNVFLEAKRYGLPLLANHCEEFSSIVENGVSGMLYADEEGFQVMLARLIADENLRRTLGHNAQLEYEERFSIIAAEGKLTRALDIILKDAT